MPNIFDSQTFYSVANSLTSTALSMYNIRTIDDVHALDIDGMFDTIQDRIDAGWIAEEYIPLVEDVVSNKDIFKKNILSRLNQLGIKEVDKQQTEEDNRLDTETGDNPDNTWIKIKEIYLRKIILHSELNCSSILYLSMNIHLLEMNRLEQLLEKQLQYQMKYLVFLLLNHSILYGIR